MLLFYFSMGQINYKKHSLSAQEYVLVNDQLTHTLNYSFYVAQTH